MYAIAQALTAELTARKCPVPVIVGPEPAGANATHERIVLSDSADGFGPARSQHVNPKQVLTRVVGGTITIYAQSTAPGATPAEHDDRRDLIVDQVLVAMSIVARKRGVSWSPKSGRPVADADLAESSIPHGAKYELQFTIDRGVYATDFKGAAAPTTTIGPGGVAIASTTKVFASGVDPKSEPDEAETSCGGGA